MPRARRKQRTAAWAIALVLLCTLLTSTGQLMFKLAAGRLEFTPMGLISNHYLTIGCIVYVLGALLLIMALKHGELSVLYPFVATSFVWVSLFSVRFLEESMTPFKWAGIASIIAGVSLIGIGSR